MKHLHRTVFQKWRDKWTISTTMWWTCDSLAAISFCCAQICHDQNQIYFSLFSWFSQPHRHIHHPLHMLALSLHLRPVRAEQCTIKIKRHIVTWAALPSHFGTKQFHHFSSLFATVSWNGQDRKHCLIYIDQVFWKKCGWWRVKAAEETDKQATTRLKSFWARFSQFLWAHAARTKMEWWSASKKDASHYYD